MADTIKIDFIDNPEVIRFRNTEAEGTPTLFICTGTAVFRYGFQSDALHRGVLAFFLQERNGSDLVFPPSWALLSIATHVSINSFYVQEPSRFGLAMAVDSVHALLLQNRVQLVTEITIQGSRMHITRLGYQITLVASERYHEPDIRAIGGNARSQETPRTSSKKRTGTRNQVRPSARRGCM